VPKSSLSIEERRELFTAIASKFEERDERFALEIQQFISDCIETEAGQLLDPTEIAAFAFQTLNYAGELRATLQSFQHSIDWMDFSVRLVRIMLDSAKEVKQLAREAGVDTEDEESVKDLRESAEELLPLDKVH
jgi:hypothetical protein